MTLLGSIFFFRVLGEGVWGRDKERERERKARKREGEVGERDRGRERERERNTILGSETVRMERLLYSRTPPSARKERNTYQKLLNCWICMILLIL